MGARTRPGDQSRSRSVRDAVIVGGGVAGLATGIELARAGRDVVCVEPSGPIRERVGESLDWSSPGLLAGLGIDPLELIDTSAATFKREVQATTSDGERLVGRPPSWISRRPLRFDSTTLHVDRCRFDARLWAEASAAGVELLTEEAVAASCEGDRITGVTLSSGRSISGRWYLDATGRARVLARSLSIGTHSYGEPRVAFWARFPSPMTVEGTTLYLDAGGSSLRWAWEIPIRKDCSSVGVVMSVGDYRSNHRSKDEAMHTELAKYQRLAEYDLSYPSSVFSRGYRCHVSDRVAGANWMLVGEAAAFVDPLASLGVTAALRSAHEASEIIIESGREKRRVRALGRYDHRVRTIAHLYNRAVNDMLYAPDIRTRLGIRDAAKGYVVLGFGLNALYSRLGPRGPMGAVELAALRGLFTTWLRLWSRPWSTTP